MKKQLTRLLIKGKHLKDFWTKFRVNQGCLLSPMLFAVYIVDIEEIL